MTNKDDFEEVMREMIKNEAESAFEKELTEDQLDYAFEKCVQDLPYLIQDKLNELEDEEELEEQNKDAETKLPRYNLYVTYLYKDNKNYEFAGSYISQEDAEKYFGFFCGRYSFEDKRITLVDKDGETDLIDTKNEKQNEKHKNCNHGDSKEANEFPF